MASTGDSWLDRSLVHWNRQDRNTPRLPRPPAVQDTSWTKSRCGEQIRQPANSTERAIASIGWKLYGPVLSHGTTTVTTAMADADGMCRPLTYQGFVHSEGRFAGTLSPVPMNSRSDGALTKVEIVNRTRLRAEFARYIPSDPLCCPSRVSAVWYSIRNAELPELTPTEMITVVTSEAERRFTPKM